MLKARPLMVDVSDKPETERKPVAKGLVVMDPETLAHDPRRAGQKGDVLSVGAWRASWAPSGRPT